MQNTSVTTGSFTYYYYYLLDHKIIEILIHDQLMVYFIIMYKMYQFLRRVYGFTYFKLNL